MAWNILKKRRSYLELGGRGPQTSGTGEPTSEAAKGKFSDLELAEKLDSGPFPPKKPLFRAEASPTPTPTPTPKPDGGPFDPGVWADWHQKQADKYKPGDKTIPSIGPPHLTPKEKEELDPDINTQPRR